MRLSIAHSVDLDDAFMFWALASGRLDPARWGFFPPAFASAETETLNRWASEVRHDVVAVSVAHVPALAQDYLLLPHGGSLGRGYGPVVVAREPFSLADLDHRRVGIPGEHTTAAQLVAHAAPTARAVVVPFYGAMDAIDAGAIDAAVLIHEGRLIYRQRGFHLVCDLGVWWQERHGLPLPLGGNVIRRALGAEVIARASDMLRESIGYALAHREAALDELLRAKPDMARADADAYLRLYANQDTLDYGSDGRASVERLLGQAVDWAP